MKVVVSIVLAMFFISAAPAHANSYLQMLTTPPEGYVPETSSDDEYFSEDLEATNIKNNLWYDSRLVTSAPIEVSPYPKYKAWLETRKYDRQYMYDPKEQLQNILYAIEGILLVAGIYMLYKK